LPQKMIRRFAFLEQKKSKKDTFEGTNREEFRESGIISILYSTLKLRKFKMVFVNLRNKLLLYFIYQPNK
ncbi:hypothetical protein, partial [Empedobacter falsenii]|uniref:hypothetical protein n=1 Tax=Empedobacter falsenii TaxID=343874 RepID=UPI0025749876